MSNTYIKDLLAQGTEPSAVANYADHSQVLDTTAEDTTTPPPPPEQQPPTEAPAERSSVRRRLAPYRGANIVDVDEIADEAALNRMFPEEARFDALLRECNSKAQETPEFSWNSMYQFALGRPDSDPQKHRLLTKIAQDFVSTAERYGRVIISELALADAERSIAPANVGGIAGGHKFIVNGILFKLARDKEFNKHFLYGVNRANAEYANKAAGHDLRGAAHFYSSLQSTALSKDIHVPLQTTVDYRGFRLVCMPMLPLTDTSLVYGSRNAGGTIENSDDKMIEAMQTLAEHLHIGGHTTANGEKLWSACDVEGHLAADGRRYILDTARTFPPESWEAENYPLQQRPCQYLYRHLRPELLQLLKSIDIDDDNDERYPPLQADALSPFDKKVLERDQWAHEIKRATEFMLNTQVPLLAGHLEAVCSAATPARALFEAPVTGDDGDDGDSPAVTAPAADQVRQQQLQAGLAASHLAEDVDIALEAHKRGINIRHLGLVRSHCQRGSVASHLLLVELVKRTLKNMLRAQLRLCRSESSAFIIRSRVVRFLNLVSAGASARETAVFWATHVQAGVVKRFGTVSLSHEMAMAEEEEESEDGLDAVARALSPDSSVLRFHLLDMIQYLLSMVGMKLSDQCLEDVSASASSVVGFRFSSADVEEGPIRTKTITVLSFAEGRMLVNEAREIAHVQRDNFGEALVDDPDEDENKSDVDSDGEPVFSMRTVQRTRTDMKAPPPETEPSNAYSDYLMLDVSDSEGELPDLDESVIPSSQLDRLQSSNSDTDDVTASALAAGSHTQADETDDGGVKKSSVAARLLSLGCARFAEALRSNPLSIRVQREAALAAYDRFIVVREWDQADSAFLGQIERLMQMASDSIIRSAIVPLLEFLFAQWEARAKINAWHGFLHCGGASSPKHLATAVRLTSELQELVTSPAARRSSAANLLSPESRVRGRSRTGSAADGADVEPASPVGSDAGDPDELEVMVQRLVDRVLYMQVYRMVAIRLLFDKISTTTDAARALLNVDVSAVATRKRSGAVSADPSSAVAGLGAATSPRSVKLFGRFPEWVRIFDTEQAAHARADIVAQPAVRRELWSLLTTASRAQQFVLVAMISELGLDVNSRDPSSGVTELMTACVHEDFELMDGLLKAKADVKAVDLAGETALHKAARVEGELGVSFVDRLLHAGADLAATNSMGETPLLVACADGNLHTAMSLLEAGSALDATNSSQRTALMLAAEGGNVALMQALLERPGCDITSRDVGGADVFALSITRPEQLIRPPVLDFLAAHPAFAGKVQDYLRIAFKASDCEPALRHLHSAGMIKLQTDLERKTVRQPSWLMLAATHGRHNSAAYLLSSSVSVNLALRKDKRTALHMAAEAGHTGVVALLLKHEANADAEDVNNKKPIQLAIENAHDEVVGLLLEQAYDGDANAMVQRYGRPAHLVKGAAMHVACGHGKLTLVRFLVEQLSADVNLQQQSSPKYTPLHCAIVGGHTHVVEYLLRAGADDQLCDDEGRDALALAQSQANASSALRSLLERADELRQGGAPTPSADRSGRKGSVLASTGADILSAVASEEVAALVNVASLGWTFYVKFLIDNYDANPNVADSSDAGRGRTPLIAAARHGHLDVVRLLVEEKHCMDKLVDASNLNALMHAAIKGRIDILDYLLSHDACSIDFQSPKGRTALMEAARHGRVNSIEWLIQHGADPLQGDVKAFNAFHHACASNRPHVVRYFMESEHAAKLIASTTRHGRTALMISASNNALDIVRMLVEDYKLEEAEIKRCDLLKHNALDIALDNSHRRVAEYLRPLIGVVEPTPKPRVYKTLPITPKVPVVTQWQCPVCTCLNSTRVNVCDACTHDRNSWSCPQCTLLNPSSSSNCEACNADRP